jgi:hypothetical protein
VPHLAGAWPMKEDAMLELFIMISTFILIIYAFVMAVNFVLDFFQDLGKWWEKKRKRGE